METSGRGYRRLGDVGLALLLVLAVVLSVLAVRHVRSRPVAGGSQGAAPITASPVAVTNTSPSVSSGPTTPSSASPTASTGSARILLIVGPAQANSWAGNATAAGWPAVVARAGWTIVRVPSLSYSADAGAGADTFPGVPTAPLPATVTPDAVVVLSSAADRSAAPATLASEASTLWHRLRVAYPKTRIVALGPAPTAGADESARTAVGTTLSAAASGTRVVYADPEPLAHAGHVTSAQFSHLLLSLIGSSAETSPSPTAS